MFLLLWQLTTKCLVRSLHFSIISTSIFGYRYANRLSKEIAAVLLWQQRETSTIFCGKRLSEDNMKL